MALKRTPLNRKTPLRAKKPWRWAAKPKPKPTDDRRRTMDAGRATNHGPRATIRPASKSGRVMRDLDRMMSRIVRLRDGGCVVCGQPGECHHIFGKDTPALRFDEDYCICVCADCHRVGTEAAHAMGQAWLEAVLRPALLRAGRTAQWSKIAAHRRYAVSESVDLKAVRARLTTRLAELESTAWMDVRDREYGRAV